MRKRPSGSWQANGLDGFGVRRFKSFTKKKDADTFLNQVVAEADRVRSGMARVEARDRDREREGPDGFPVEAWVVQKAAAGGIVSG